MTTTEAVLRLVVLGCRGSMATEGERFATFGGSTSCYLVEAGPETIILDAGTGIMHAPVGAARPLHILISHPHLDHVMGLGMYERLCVPGATTHILLAAATDEEARATMDKLYAPPLWPLGLSDLPGDVRIGALGARFTIGEVGVTCVEGNHPGGCVATRLDYQGKSIVYLGDYEREERSLERLVDLTRDADLVLFDAQYTRESYPAHKGFGHSTPEDGIELMERAGARRMLLVHHDPGATDTELLARERSCGRQDVAYAREGMEVVI